MPIIGVMYPDTYMYTNTYIQMDVLCMQDSLQSASTCEFSREDGRRSLSVAAGPQRRTRWFLYTHLSHISAHTPRVSVEAQTP